MEFSPSLDVSESESIDELLDRANDAGRVLVGVNCSRKTRNTVSICITKIFIVSTRTILS